MKTKTKIIIGGLVLLFILILLVYLFDKNLIFDEAIYKFVRSFSNSFFDKYFVLVTKAGNSVFIFGLVLVFLILLRNYYGIILSISTIIGAVSNAGIKQIFRRIRPVHLRLIEQGGYSFPSGHAMISICVYGYLSYLVNKKIKNKYLRLVLCLFLVILILSIGISRIYVGVHYPTDVIAGYLLAMIEVILLVEFTNKRGNLNV